MAAFERVVSLILIAGGLSVAAPAIACSPAPPDVPEPTTSIPDQATEAIRHADAIIEAIVVRPTTFDLEKRKEIPAMLSVLRRWKGPRQPLYFVYTDGCGAPYRKKNEALRLLLEFWPPVLGREGIWTAPRSLNEPLNRFDFEPVNRRRPAKIPEARFADALDKALGSPRGAQVATLPEGW